MTPGRELVPILLWVWLVHVLGAEHPEVGYYCVIMPRSVPELFVRIDLRGQEYARLDGLLNNGMADPQCGKTSFTKSKYSGVYSRHVYLSQSCPACCGAKQVNKGKWQWRFHLQEKDGIVSINDNVAVLTCDFSKADTMSRETRQRIQRQRNVSVTEYKIPATKEVVSLSVVDAVTLLPVNKVELGSWVKLSLRLATRNDAASPHSVMQAIGVSAFNCAAYTPDRAHSIQLTDILGCPFKESPMSGMHSFNYTAITDSFAMFTLPESSVVAFKCQFKYCFKNELTCQDLCQPRHRMRRRRSEHAAGIKMKPVYTTVTVLHDINKEVGVEPDHSRVVPLYYLNPITCSVFLLLLTVFLMMYVFFIRSLKRTVDSMKEELLYQTRRQGVAIL